MAEEAKCVCGAEGCSCDAEGKCSCGDDCSCKGE